MVCLIVTQVVHLIHQPAAPAAVMSRLEKLSQRGRGCRLGAEARRAGIRVTSAPVRGDLQGAREVVQRDQPDAARQEHSGLCAVYLKYKPVIYYVTRFPIVDQGQNVKDSG